MKRIFLAQIENNEIIVLREVAPEHAQAALQERASALGLEVEENRIARWDKGSVQLIKV